jgi:hypothetical protein
MKTDPRDLAFIEPVPEFAGLKMRPFSAGTLTLCRALNLSVVLASAEGVSEADKQEQLVTLLFIQSQPLETVKTAVKIARQDRQAFRDDFLLPFEMGLPVSALPKIFKELEAVFAAVEAAEFDVKGGESAKAADPNA